MRNASELVSMGNLLDHREMRFCKRTQRPPSHGPHLERILLLTTQYQVDQGWYTPDRLRERLLYCVLIAVGIQNSTDDLQNHLLRRGLCKQE